MNETEFHDLADTELSRMSDGLEEADQSGALTAECASGVLTIELPDGRQCVVSKHAPSRQLWLSSPLSGGLHFSHGESGWVLADGRTLGGVLAQDLQTLASVKVGF